MDLRVRDKGYLIVGGTSGMGLATAQVLAAEGAKLVITGRDPKRAAAAGEALEAEGRVWPVTGDVSNSDDVNRMVDTAVGHLGGLDGVAVLTGIIGHEPIEVSDERWIEIFQDVLLGTTRVVQSALPHLADGGGTIVTTSAYSIRAPEIARLPYASLKAAVAVFTKGIAKTYGPQGIRANCIAPGAIETEGMHAMRGMLAEQRGWPFDEAIERIMETEWDLKVGLRRPGRPQEVGELISFLLSERAGYLTGALLNIDGGTDF
jgi:3-oxoacyl-[acyl-carrier protein] reductase